MDCLVHGVVKSRTRVSDFHWHMLVVQLCLTLCNPMDCSPPGSSIHWILQTRILELVAFPFSSGSSRPRNQTGVSCIAGGFFTN